MSDKKNLKKIAREEKKQKAKRKWAIASLFKWIIGLWVIVGIFYYANPNMISDLWKVSPEDMIKDHVRWSWSWDIVVIEYSDFQCPACFKMHKIIEDSWFMNDEKMQLIFKHYPLSSIHPYATLAAQYAEAAWLQGKFWEMHDMLFDNQSAWTSVAVDEIEDTYISYWEELWLDIEKLKTDAHWKIVKAKIESDFMSAKLQKLSYTPTLILNWEIVENPPHKYWFMNMITFKDKELNPERYEQPPVDTWAAVWSWESILDVPVSE